MKISIITVVYNNEKTIEDAILSVLSQSYQDIEYIVIDGNSTDQTISIINRYRDKISKFVSEKDSGIYDAMNKGVLMATGEVIGILNSDDVYTDENVIQDVFYHFDKNKNLQSLYGDLVYVSPNDIKKVVRSWTSRQYYESFFEDGNVPPHPALFIKKEVYDCYGVFNLKFRLAADYDLMLRILKKYNISTLYIQRLMVRMRLGGATNKSINNIIKGNKEIIKSWEVNGFKIPLKLMPLRVLRRLMQFI